MLSDDGRCKTFDARANGYARGEGVGSLTLRESSPSSSTLAVDYLGSRIRSDGKSASLTAPSGKAQMRLLNEVLAAAGTSSLSLVEAHGTGTPLGDPTEMGGLENPLESSIPCLGGVKANFGHTEPAAGLLGLMALVRGARQEAGAANAQLRIVNPMVGPRLHHTGGRLPTQLLDLIVEAAGVSSFGYSGTIVHAIIKRFVSATDSHEMPVQILLYQRRSFSWCEVSHPFIQFRQSPVERGTCTAIFHSRMQGSLHTIVADHIVEGRVVFPAAGFLEMARAAASRSDPSTKLRAVFFLLPLTLSDQPNKTTLAIECSHLESFEISSITPFGSHEVHCTGNLTAVKQPCAAASSLTEMRRRCPEHVSLELFYGLMDQTGLNYGPAFRAVDSVWVASDQNSRVATLRARKFHRGTLIHPADLDGALQLSIVNFAPESARTRLPFAIEGAQLSACGSCPWSCVEEPLSESSTITLASKQGGACTLVDGFKAREVRASSKREPWYQTQWRVSKSPATSTGLVQESLVFMTDDYRLSDRVNHICTSISMTLAACSIERASAIVVSSPVQQGPLQSSGVFVAAASLAILQLAAPPQKVVFITSSTQHAMAADVILPSHAGPWGLARTARAEGTLLVRSTDVTRSMCASATLTAIAKSCATQSGRDHESALRARTVCVPRLVHAPKLLQGSVSLVYLPRGALNNLAIEVQPSFTAPMGVDQAELRVKAVGLNFRDVLNVLGEYPGDPGPPGIDCAGNVTKVEECIDPTFVSAGGHAFGMGNGALGSITRTDVRLLAVKPESLTFEGIATLPITWTTVHVALSRAQVSSRHRLLVHAAAGGVGLKATEYAHWLQLRATASAGGRHKHQQLTWLGVEAGFSSRDVGAFSHGLSAVSNASRLCAVLNSLSHDFISSSLALLCEHGAFKEIGKRGIWAKSRHSSAASHSAYFPIAIDADLAEDPGWMHRLLHRLAQRARAGSLASLPLRSFDLQAQAELAFRSLQSGLNTGKIVVRVSEDGRRALGGCHVITGGTGGLGCLTARWLSENGASRVLLASRSGKRAAGSENEWSRIMSSRATTEVDVMKCDSADDVDVQRLGTCTKADLGGTWHAAGVLADGMLNSQTAGTMLAAYAPKVHGAWALQHVSVAHPLRVSLQFSSIASLLGNPGQANYSSANACLDGLAAFRRTHGTAGASVQWGPWGQIGMAVAGVAANRLAALGFGLISPAHGLLAMQSLIRDGSPAVVGVVPLNWGRYLSAAPEVPTFLESFAVRTRSGGKNAPVPAVSSGISLQAVLDMVKRTAGGEVDSDAPLMDAGVDSLGAVELRNQLQRVAGKTIAIPSTIVFDYPTARALAVFLAPKVVAIPQSREAIPRAVHPGSRSSVTVFGASSAVPGGATTTKACWGVASTACNVMSEVPAERWLPGGLPPAMESIRIRIMHGGFVRSAHCFDNTSHGISLSEAIAMDPQQRMLLEFGYAAFHSCDLTREGLAQSLTAVYVGISTLDFNELLQSSPLGATVYAATGSSHSISSGRLAYTMGTNGPCLTIDTACSAALAASHSAASSLRQAECVRVLAAGVNLVLTPVTSSRFAMAGMSSPRGRCHTFDKGADGYGRSDSCCSAVISIEGSRGVTMLGSAVRQDGRSASLTAPSGQAQGGLITAALADAGSSADEIVLHEAHGTGTALGDPIEAGSLVAAMLSSRGDQTSPVPVGGVKANIGHAEPAAGMTGLLKLAAGMLKKVSAANAQLRALNPMVSSAFRDVSCSLAVQPGGLAGDAPAHGGVSSFGYSGTIVHAILCQGSTSVPSLCTSLRVTGSKRRAFLWQNHAHPFTQRLLPLNSDGCITFSSPASGAMRDIVADHVVQGRILFPAAGYLEMARSAAAAEAALQGVFFMRPLAIETPGLLVECMVIDGRFEVRSGESDDALMDSTAHCAGAFTTPGSHTRVNLVPVRAGHCARAAGIKEIYDGFSGSGLQYGRGFRTLVQAWGGANDGVAKLQARSTMRMGTQVHPADLDDALCTIALMDVDMGSSKSETRLPFAVNEAHLQGTLGQLWAVCRLPILTQIPSARTHPCFG